MHVANQKEVIDQYTESCLCIQAFIIQVYLTAVVTGMYIKR